MYWGKLLILKLEGKKYIFLLFDAAELLKIHVYQTVALTARHAICRIMESIEDVLQFNQIFGVQSSEPGFLIVEFVLSIVWKLLDATLDDEGLLELTQEKQPRWPIKSQHMEVDYLDSFDGKRMEHQAAFCKANTVMAIELIGEFLQNKISSRILYLARRNM